MRSLNFSEPVVQKEKPSPKPKMKEKSNTRQKNCIFAVWFCDFDEDLIFSVISDSRSKLDESWLDYLSDSMPWIVNWIYGLLFEHISLFFFSVNAFED